MHQIQTAGPPRQEEKTEPRVEAFDTDLPPSPSASGSRASGLEMLMSERETRVKPVAAHATTSGRAFQNKSTQINSFSNVFVQNTITISDK